MIILIAGASGAGKSELAHRLARRMGMPLVELDDIVQALQAVTTPAQLPLLHLWDTDPAARELPPDRIVELMVSLSEMLLPAVDAVIDNHLVAATPVVLEGDYLLPATARPGVRALVLHEPSQEQITANYAGREGPADQSERALVSRMHGDLLAARAAAVGVPVVAARPWDDVVDRALAALGLEDYEIRRIVSG